MAATEEAPKKMVQGTFTDKDDLHNRDLSRKPVAQLSNEEKRELKRRFEEFVTAMRKGRSAPQGDGKPRAKPVKWDPTRHLTKARSS